LIRVLLASSVLLVRSGRTSATGGAVTATSPFGTGQPTSGHSVAVDASGNGSFGGLGTAGADPVTGLAIDASGKLFVAGSSSSSWMTQATNAGGADALVLRGLP
jgi:hypothetical protein